MRKLLSLSALFCLTVGLYSCSKGANENNDENNIAQTLSRKIGAIPDVPQCPAGEHWSFTLNKCVPTCTPPSQIQQYISSAGGGGGESSVKPAVKPTVIN